jgi:hypothetical protein
MSWNLWGSSQANFGNRLAEKVCATLLNSWRDTAKVWMLSQCQVCWTRLWRVGKNRDWQWKLVFSIQSWNKMTKHRMAWNEFSLAEESHVANIACQTNDDLIFKCCQNYPLWLCSWGHHSQQSLLFRSEEMSVGVHVLSETSSSETRAGCCCMKTCLLTTC